MKIPSYLLLTALCIGLWITFSGEVQAAEEGLAVVGYVQAFRMDTLNEASLGMLDELIYHGFRAKPDGTVQRNPYKSPQGWQMQSDFNAEMKSRLQAIRELHPGLKIRMGVIGHADEFGPTAADPMKRKAFAQQLLELCREGKFVGVDLDYEYPDTKQQEADYDRLITEVCRTLQAEGFTVTAALSHWKLPSRIAARRLDGVHLMSYDKPSGHHSTFEDAEKQIEVLLDFGVRADHLYLGLPFYGRSLKDFSKSISYADLLEEGNPQAGDEDVLGEWAFNSIETLQRKVQLAREKRLAGVMIWEIGQDAPEGTPLLNAVRDAAGRKP